MKKSIYIKESKNDKGEAGFSVLGFQNRDCILDEFFYMSEFAIAFTEHWMTQDYREWNNIISWRKH